MNHNKHYFIIPFILLLSLPLIQGEDFPLPSPKKVLVYGSFLRGHADFMQGVAYTISSKGAEQRLVHYLVPEGYEDLEFAKQLGIYPIEIPGYTQ